MRITVLGSGNVATHLAVAFFGRGHTIEQVWSRSISHAYNLACKVQAEPIDDLAQLNDASDVYIIAVSDNALPDLALSLSLPNALVLHTSGATPIKVLKHVSSHCGIIWSPQSFLRDVAMDYSTLPFCIEGSDEKTEQSISDFVGLISNYIYLTTLQQRQYLHLAAVMVNNFVNGLYGLAQQMCEEQGLPFELLYPIMTTTTQRAMWGDIRPQLTGPAVRGDDKTLNVHRKLLAKEPFLLDLYNQLTQILQTRLAPNPPTPSHK